ncbi:MAG: epoxyqueuosine reductase [Spirochaetales bacterium]|nr:epoxyqueuosine reductase [Spirochaetales bacterium]
MEIKAEKIKEKALSLGADLCGIASIERFSNLPSSLHPGEIVKGSHSVIVIAKKFLHSTVGLATTIPYTIIRNYSSRELDEISIKLSYYLEDIGFIAVPTGAIEPCNYDKEISKIVGLISLKNAAYQSGLGVIGKNTLLITPKYGNMVWLGAVITSANLEPDQILTNNPCTGKCRVCIDNCPVNAIDGSNFMDQEKCWNFAFGEAEGGEWRIKCFSCREKCPFSKGYK